MPTGKYNNFLYSIVYSNKRAYQGDVFKPKADAKREQICTDVFE